MNKKKYSSFSDLGGLVYSTKDTNVDSDENHPNEKALEPSSQSLEAHFSNKGRGGKIVTVIKGFEGSETDLKQLGKRLKNKCGVGGSVKDGEIIIQGNNRDKIMKLLQNEGYKVKRVGG